MVIEPEPPIVNEDVAVEVMLPLDAATGKTMAPLRVSGLLLRTTRPLISEVVPLMVGLLVEPIVRVSAGLSKVKLFMPVVPAKLISPTVPEPSIVKWELLLVMLPVALQVIWPNKRVVRVLLFTIA